MDNDWLYSEDRLAFREKVLSILLRSYGQELDEKGVPVNSNESIYACAHDWVSQGHRVIYRLNKYYETYYQGVKST